MENNSEKGLLGFEAFDVMNGELKSINGFKEYTDADDLDLTDEQLAELTGTKSGLLDAFGSDDPSDKFKSKKDKEDKEDDSDDSDDDDEKAEPKRKPGRPVGSTKKTDDTTKEDEDDEDDADDNDDEENEDGLSENPDSDNAISAFFDLINEDLGLELGEDETKPKTVKELVGLINEVIEDNSVPSYANEEVANIDEFVRNGGKLEDYFAVVSDIDLDTLDIASESNQERVVKEFLSKKGFSNTQINKKIAKYKDADLLEDEAEDALESLKEIKIQEKEALLDAQKNQHDAAVLRQQKFINDVVDNVKALDNVRGIAIPKKDKEKLLAYILKADSTGKTAYQKDYEKNSVKNLLESAYFTMKGDALLSSAENTGRSAAIRNFKQSLNSSTNVSKGAKRIKTDLKSDSFDQLVQRLYGK